MRKADQLIKAAMSAFLAMSLAHEAQAAPDSSSQNQEKCYGLVKAAKNDCATATASCAGSSTKDKQGDAFIFLPTGACEKLSGGSLTPIKE
jgi:uncharacterized membrane protein